VVLPVRLYPNNYLQLDPGVVVEHRHLDDVFAWIAAHQQERDALDSPAASSAGARSGASWPARHRKSPLHPANRQSPQGPLPARRGRTEQQAPALVIRTWSHGKAVNELTMFLDPLARFG
jgi:hypothetical protein